MEKNTLCEKVLTLISGTRNIESMFANITDGQNNYSSRGEQLIIRCKHRIIHLEKALTDLKNELSKPQRRKTAAQR